MSVESDHQQIEGLLGAYVLDAVEPEESARVERHLEECPRCRAEVDAGREVAGRLGTSARVGDAEPLPPGLWDRIADGIATSTRRPAAPMPGLGAESAPVPEVVSITDATRGRRRRWKGAAWAAAAVAVAAVVAVAVLGVDLARTNNQPTKSTAARVAMATPAHRLVRLDSSDGVQLAEFVVLPDGQGFMVSSHMPTLPSDETYQLWAIIAGKPISLGLLGHQPERASFTLASTATPSDLALTVEPAGGVAAPTEAPVASGHVS
jgi:anti-sigma-K factor RskA